MYKRQGLDRRFEERQPSLVQNAGELDDEDAVRDHDAGHHDDAHQRHDVERAAGEQQDHDYPCQAGRNGHQDDKRIDKRGELRHENEVHQCDGDQQSQTEALKCVVHAHHATTQGEKGIPVGPGVGDQLADLLSNLLQRFGLGGNIDVDDAADLIVINFRRRVDLMDLSHRL